MVKLRTELTTRSVIGLTRRLHVTQREIDNEVKIALTHTGKKIKEVMKKPLQGPMPYGTGPAGVPPVVSRSGKLPAAIGYRIEKTKSYPGHRNRRLLTVGVIKGDKKTKSIINMHEFGRTLHADPGSRLVWAPFKTEVARDPATGSQTMTIQQASARYDDSFATKRPLDTQGKAGGGQIGKDRRFIYFRSSPEAKPLLGFIAADWVEVPARRVISSSIPEVNKIQQDMLSIITLKIKNIVEDTGA